jgi:DNA-binding GntR family transcriptional regulator
MEISASTADEVHQTRAEYVADRIERAILRGELAAGERIVEAALAEQLHVSKTPIREALLVLARKGVVTSHAYRGAFVREIDPVAAKQLYEVRLLNEPEAVVRATPYHDAASLTASREALLAARNVGQGPGALGDLALANRRFHRSLYAPCKNDHLRRILDEIQDQVAMVSVSTWRRHATWAEEEAEHSAILQAVSEGNETGVRTLMTAHIAGFFSRLES